MIISKNIEQGSEEWHKLRKGRATASEADKIITSTGKPSTQRLAYMRKLARECVADDPHEWTGNKYTDWGNATEAEAREYFAQKTKLHVQEVGFCGRNDNAPIGCSPDGLIVGDQKSGHFIAGLELKCPQVDTHVGYLIDGNLPTAYKVQVHWSMATTGLRKWYFLSFFPGLQALCLCVEWDDFTDKVRAAQDEFVMDYAGERKRVLEAITIKQSLGAKPLALECIV